MPHLIKMWLEAPVEETDARGNNRRSTRNRDEGRGTPQGAPIRSLPINRWRIWIGETTKVVHRQL
jgi:hypothetical protein